MPLETSYDISIIVPCYNEEKKIGFTISSLFEYLNRKDYWKSEIIIANDGSSDKTIEIVREKQAEYKFTDLRIIEHFPNRGRGSILSKAFKKANGNVVIYMDADLATELAYVDNIFQELQHSHVVTGSRMLKDSIVSRPLSREILSRVYNLLVRVVIQDGIKDHQCGFKGLQKKIIPLLMSQVESKGWFWDTELLVLAKHKNLIVKEIPVEWHEFRGKKESKVKIINTVKDYIFEILWLRTKINRRRKTGF